MLIKRKTQSKPFKFSWAQDFFLIPPESSASPGGLRECLLGWPLCHAVAQASTYPQRELFLQMGSYPGPVLLGTRTCWALKISPRVRYLKVEKPKDSLSQSLTNL